MEHVIGTQPGNEMESEKNLSYLAESELMSIQDDN